MSRPSPGSIVPVAWRGGALRAEPTMRRPAVVVEDSGLLPDAYPNLLVVPLTKDQGLVYPSFTERIEPNQENGATQTCWALAHHVTSVSVQKVTQTPVAGQARPIGPHPRGDQASGWRVAAGRVTQGPFPHRS